MQFAELADARRSIRSYLPTDVSNQQVRRLLSVARQAPSGANLQPGHFLRVQGTHRARLSDELVRPSREGRREEEDYGVLSASDAHEPSQTPGRVRAGSLRRVGCRTRPPGRAR
jgi:nitroreductase